MALTLVFGNKNYSSWSLRPWIAMKATGIAFEEALVPLHVGDAALCSAVSRRLLDEFGMYATPINYPTVPRGEERLRLTPTPLHTDEMMDRLVTALSTILISARRVAA